MKAAMNGALNLSILDGWWPEGCEHGINGWAIGGADAGDDEKDMRALYDTIEHEVLPAWADRVRWLAMMRASITMAAERFSAARMVRDYFDKVYATAPEPAPSAIANNRPGLVPALGPSPAPGPSL